MSIAGKNFGKTSRHLRCCLLEIGLQQAGEQADAFFDILL